MTALEKACNILSHLNEEELNAFLILFGGAEKQDTISPEKDASDSLSINRFPTPVECDALLGAILQYGVADDFIEFEDAYLNEISKLLYCITKARSSHFPER